MRFSRDPGQPCHGIADSVAAIRHPSCRWDTPRVSCPTACLLPIVPPVRWGRAQWRGGKSAFEIPIHTLSSRPMNALIITENILQALVAWHSARQHLRPHVRRPWTDLRGHAGHQFRPRRFLDARNVCHPLLFGWLGLGQSSGPTLGPSGGRARWAPVVLYGFGVFRTAPCCHG